MIERLSAHDEQALLVVDRIEELIGIVIGNSIVVVQEIIFIFSK